MKHSISIKTTNGLLSVADFKEQHISKFDVIGVVLQTETIGMVISLDQWDEIWCGEDNLDTFNEAYSEVEALQTLSGLELTRNIVKRNKKDGEGMTAAKRCWQYGKGGLQWYLPCLYELAAIIAYYDELNKVFRMLGADIIDKYEFYWSSFENSNVTAWYANFSNGLYYGYKCFYCLVRAVSTFSPLKRGNFHH